MFYFTNSGHIHTLYVNTMLYFTNFPYFIYISDNGEKSKEYENQKASSLISKSLFSENGKRQKVHIFV